MAEIKTLFTSFQELLLDLDIFGRLMTTQSVDDKQAYKDLMFQEYSRAHPLPSLLNKDTELSDLVSEDFYVSYRKELELSQNEEVLNFEDDEDEEDEVSEFALDVGSLTVPDSLRHIGCVSIEDRDVEVENLLSDIEPFSGDIEVVESVFNTTGEQEGYLIEQEKELSDEEVFEEEQVESESEDEDEDYDDYDDYDDSEEESDSDVAEEQDTQQDDEEEYSEPEIDLVGDSYITEDPVVIVKPEPIVVERPAIIIPVIKEQVTRSVPSDLLQFLRENPRCEISEVLKYYPRKDLEKYIRIGKVIKKGSRVYI